MAPKKQARGGKSKGTDAPSAPRTSGRPRKSKSKNEDYVPEEDEDVDEVMVDGEGDTPYVDGLDTFADDSDVSDADTLADRWEGGAIGDFTGLKLKDDHANRPLWVCPDGHIYLETFSPIYKQACDFLIAVAEPVCRPECVHEYNLTPHSLYAAVSVGLTTQTIINVLGRLSKAELPEEIRDFVQKSTSNYGKVKLVLQRNKFFVESPYPEILKELLDDDTIKGARVQAEEDGNGGDTFVVAPALREAIAVDLATDGDEAGKDAMEVAAPEKELHSFEINPVKVEHVKRRCLPGALDYPMLEEYDFRNDSVNPHLNIELKPNVDLRPYQDKSMAKMFGNGRARSGIIVLPCGAGKSLVGISAAARVKKSVLCLVTNNVSVDQWRHQFQLWTNLQGHQIARFTSDQNAKEMFAGASGIVITTYSMVAYSGRRSEESTKVMEAIAGREWGLLLLDEVHVVPAQMFRKVIGIVKAHCKLGLTATLVREDELISDLNFLIGPKLYEANWLDLTRAGHIANVQCVEVWCPMTKEFFKEYLRPENSAKKQLLYVMNPNKFMACEFLVNYHERMRGDKIIVFSDNIFALREYARRMHKPFIYGATGHAERTQVLHAFKHKPEVNTIFLSKVGDNSIDIPEANVLIQVSSHAGSRRQEAQRLGRILRAKPKPAGAGSGEPADEYNAFFYTLVSQDTQEMYFSSKRQQFLVDQGYAFKVVTNLLDSADTASLQLGGRDAQLDLLARVLAAGEEDAATEDLADADGLPRQRVSQVVARRTKGSISTLTGADGRTYMEYHTGGQRKAKPLKRKHALFRQRAQGLF
ncbi:hypothetical protein WJX73_004570 [Symbiochloris irregularis]|uniref:DNA 3'-5' helicase n=1 Tax=Symbiochloris irregularis TaxID=706552 RepID=A0AAW1PVY1_9CHLO